MSQAEVEHAKLQFELGEFRIVEYKTAKRRIICHVNETTSLELKQTNCGVIVMIKSASKYVTITREVFKFICDSYMSIDYLCSILEKSVKKHD